MNRIMISQEKQPLLVNWEFRKQEAKLKLDILTQK